MHEKDDNAGEDGDDQLASQPSLCIKNERYLLLHRLDRRFMRILLCEDILLNHLLSCHYYNLFHKK